MSSTDEPKEEALLAPSRSSRILLPEGYYLEHFKDFLAIVESTYARLLNETERRFLDDFRLLSEWEQRLFVRMANRTGEVFLASALRYSEIPELPDVLHSLIQKGFLRRVQQKDFPS